MGLIPSFRRTQAAAALAAQVVVLRVGAAPHQITRPTGFQKGMCINSAAAPTKKHSRDLLRPHGLGLGILDRLAAQYNGSLDTRYQSGEFETTLILHFPEHENMP